MFCEQEIERSPVGLADVLRMVSIGRQHKQRAWAEIDSLRQASLSNDGVSTYLGQVAHQSLS
jgi:hypothetical protein